MNLSYVINPFIISGVVAVVVSVCLIWLVTAKRAAIVQLLGKLFTRAGFFWTVNVIFMAVSVVHAGAFFGLGSSGINQLLGFAVSFFLDLVTIILMQALIESKYRGDNQKASKFLLFIVICCATSMFANLAISLNNFKPKEMLPDAPFWVQMILPYILASFPLLVILMSVAATMIVNIRSLDSLDAKEFDEAEKKRLAVIKIRNEYLQKLAKEQQRATAIRMQMKQNKKLAKTTKLEDLLSNKSTSLSNGSTSEEDVDIKEADMTREIEVVQDEQEMLDSVDTQMDMEENVDIKKVDMTTDTEAVQDEQEMLESVDTQMNVKKDVEANEVTITTHIEVVQDKQAIPDSVDTQMDMEEDEEQDADVHDHGHDAEPEVDTASVLQFHLQETSKRQRVDAEIVGRRKSLSISEAAGILECSERQVRRLREQGTLVIMKDGRIAAASVRAYQMKKLAMATQTNE